MVCKLFSWSAAGCTQLLQFISSWCLWIKVPVYYDTHVKFGKAQFKIVNFSFACSALLLLCSASNMAHTSMKNEFGVCGLVYSNTFEVSMLFVSVVVGQLGPFVVLSFPNFIFSVSLLTRRAQSVLTTANQNGTTAPGLSNTHQQQLREASIEKGYVKMLFLLTSSFLFFNAASTVPLLLASNEASRLKVALSLLFVDLNHAGNFFFYFISGPMFRKALRKTLFKPSSQTNNPRSNNAPRNPFGHARAGPSASEGQHSCQETAFQ